MEMILTSATVSGGELRSLSLVAQTFPSADGVVAGAMASAAKIASRSAPVVALAKQAILSGEFSCYFHPPFFPLIRYLCCACCIYQSAI
jgi:enoyl-CoA hydratase/carnithine racemase